LYCLILKFVYILTKKQNPFNTRIEPIFERILFHFDKYAQCHFLFQ